MKIFISWSGERSQALAGHLREWLPDVLDYAQPWMSAHDIAAGDRWLAEISRELEGCNFGLICITPDNINSSWILFESGALAKSIEDAKVIPLLLGVEMKDLSGPLSQFQAKKVDQAGLRDVILSINKAAGGKQPENRVRKLADALWPEMARKINEIREPLSLIKKQKTEQQILEELVASVRSLESRVRSLDEQIARTNAIDVIASLPSVPTFSARVQKLADRAMSDPNSLLQIAQMTGRISPEVSEAINEAHRQLELGGPEYSERVFSDLLLRLSHMQREAARQNRSSNPSDTMVIERELPRIVFAALDRSLREAERGSSRDNSPEEL